jgi:NADPH-dependent curcumin reductase CurA
MRTRTYVVRGRRAGDAHVASVRTRVAATGWPTSDNLRLTETRVSAPTEGQVVVRNLVMSVDPYMRPRKNDAMSYVRLVRSDTRWRAGRSARSSPRRSTPFAKAMSYCTD